MKSLYSGSAITAAALIAGTLFIYARPLVAETNSLQQPPIQQQKRREDSASGSRSTLANPSETSELITRRAALAGKVAAAEALSTSETVKTAAVGSAQTYVATCYSLRGRTASGRMVAKGLIAADPKVLPLGSRVRLDAGPFSGEYLVADTGGAVRGRHIDIWTPSTREAMRFGRRKVKVTVLSYGARRGTRPRRVRS